MKKKWYGYMIYAPILVFGYNRPKHLKKTLDALADNIDISESDIFIFLDGKKENDSSEKVEITRNMVALYQSKDKFKSFNVIKSEHNKGLANSIIDGVTDIIERYGSAIVLEDDLLTSKDFVIFMNEALSYYKDDKRVWSVSGFSQRMRALDELDDSVYFVKRATSWGWATWLDRWNMCDWNVRDYKFFRYNLISRIRFNMSGADLSSMLDRQMIGIIDSWAIRWCYSQYKKDMLTVCPKMSKVKNIGMDGSGTNTGTSEENKTRNYHFSELKCTLIPPKVNKELLREFRAANRISLRSRFSRFIKYNILFLKQ